jgi:hypothetical protein
MVPCWSAGFSTTPPDNYREKPNAYSTAGSIKNKKQKDSNTYFRQNLKKWNYSN